MTKFGRVRVDRLAQEGYYPVALFIFLSKPFDQPFIMKRILTLFVIGSLLTVAACQVKPKTQEAGVNDTATMSTDTTTMTADSASTMASDSAN